MAEEIIVPSLGEVVVSVTILKWLKAEGDTVEKGEPLLEVESEKVTVQIESPASGVLGKILFPEDSKVSVTQVVGIILAEGEALPGDYDKPSQKVTGKPRETSRQEAALGDRKSGHVRAAPVARKLAEQHGIDLSLVKPTGPHGTIMKKDVEAYLAPSRETKTPPSSFTPAGLKMPIKASPLARSMAETHDLDLSIIRGSGPGGRIVKEDVLRTLDSHGATAAIGDERRFEETPKAMTPKELLESIPIRGARRAIFDNMYRSLRESAQLTLHTEAGAESLNTLREHLSNEKQKISYNAIILKITATALRQHPRINASVEGDTIRVWRQIHIGLATEADETLLVPVIRHADLKTIQEIDHEISELILKIRGKRLSPDDLAHGTFTITNLGFADIEHFTPIIRPPESAILGVGRIVKKPWVRNDKVIPEARIGLSLTLDHRIIDGAPAARFLKTLKDMIEDPLLMIA